MSGMLHVFLFFIFALTPPLVIFRGSVSAVWDRPCAVRDVEPKTNCPGILDRKSPNRQVINSSPLIPFGDAPLNAESASTKPVADPKPEPVPATMADRKAVHSLLIDRPYGEIVATMDWAYRSTGRRTSLCQEHIEGVISQEACPVCAYDKRNHATHGIDGRRKAKAGAQAEAVRP